MKHYLMIVNRQLKLNGSGPSISRSMSDPEAAISPPWACASSQPKMKTVRKDDVVWLIGRVRFGNSELPPTLIAKLTALGNAAVRAEIPDERVPEYFLPEHNNGKDWSKFILFADKRTSAYLPWNDFWTILRRTKLRGNEPTFQAQGYGPHWLPGHASIFRQLQSIRTIDEVSLRRFQSHYAQMSQRPTVFLSYRWSEATHLALELTRQLYRKGFCAWWDRCSLPRHVSEGNSRFDLRILTREILTHLRSCQHFVALRTPSYEESVGTKVEWSAAQRLARKNLVSLHDETVPRDRCTTPPERRQIAKRISDGIKDFH